jgi:putative transposase
MDDIFGMHTAGSSSSSATGTRSSAPPSTRANAYAERWIRTVRTECLDWILVCNRRHLAHLLAQYIAHYNAARPHRGIDLDMPVPPPAPVGVEKTGRIERVDVLGGLLHDYRRTA